MSPQTPYETLFSPLEIGPIRVQNRICETTNSIGAGAMAGFIDDGFIAHHSAKARGGTAWIGGETMLLNSPMPAEAADEFFPGSGAIRVPIYLMPGFVESVAKYTDTLHELDAVAVFQLTHLNMTMAASAVPVVEIYDFIPHELDDTEIEAIIASYAAAAEKLREAGADGIEVHCAHETVPQTFLSPATNRRTDRWGGGVEGRTLFVRRILEAVRDRAGDSMALGIRINASEDREGGYDTDEMREMMRWVGKTSTIDFVNLDVGHCWGNPSYVPSSYVEPATHREAGRALRQDLPDVRILLAGGIRDAAIAEELLASGCCDLVGMTRAGIADPEFAAKARAGRSGEIRPCIGCNRCIAESIRNDAPDVFKRPVCSVNPEIGHEIHYALTRRPAAERRRFVVVGGGPAGLEAARVAADRGHEVLLLERAGELGGLVRLSSRTPGRSRYGDLVGWQRQALERLGVEVRLGTDAKAADILALEPHAVACATGARALVPEAPGVDAAHVVTGTAVLEGDVELGDRVAVVSQEDYFQTPSIAGYLAERVDRVEVFHKWMGIGSRIDRYSLGPVMHHLTGHGVVFHDGLRLAWVEGRRLGFVSSFGAGEQVFEGFDQVVLVCGAAPDTRLHRELAADGRVAKLFLVGNAWVPRGLAEATQHGARVGMEV